MPCSRGVVSTAADGARYGSLYSWLTSVDAIQMAPANIRRPATGPRRTRTLRFIQPFATPLTTMPPSLDVRGRVGHALQPLAFELSDVGDDRPPVCGGDRPAVASHQPFPVGNDVEDLPVRILQDVLLVERGGGHVAALEEDALAFSPRVVARLAIDRVALPPAVHGRRARRHGALRDELPIRPLPREEHRVFLQPADRDRAGHRLAHRGAVVEERAGRLRQHLRLVVHARIQMDGRTARRAAARAAAEGEHREQRHHAQRRPATTPNPPTPSSATPNFQASNPPPRGRLAETSGN